MLTRTLRLAASRAFSSAAAAQQQQTVGFIGLGNMGGHMAHNLLKAGHKLVVFDVNASAVALAVERGAKAAASPKQVAQEASAVVTMLPSSPHVRHVYEGEDGVFEGVQKDALLIDSSTIDVSTARSVAARAGELGARMVDAPVSGGVGGAEAGTLTFMVGGDERVFEAARPLLERMGKNIVHCGDSGTGQVAKIANNLVLAISMVATSEGMNLGVRLGMDPKKLAGIFNTSSARCWSSDTYNPCPGVMENVPAARGYTGGFGVDLMKKDLGLAMQAAAESGVSLPLGASTYQLYNLLSSHGNGKRDFSSIYEWLARKDN